jgi:hypothetical protein
LVSPSSVGETIIIGQQTFSREKGKWTELKLPHDEERDDMHEQCTLQSGPPALPGSVARTTEVVGREIVNGVQVMTYKTELEFNAASGGKDSMVYTASVGVSDGRLYRVEMNTSRDPSLNIHSVTTYSNDSSISIESPV